MRDNNTRAMLIEAVIAGGLIAIGIPTGQPLLALAAAATSVGCNWTHNLAERGFQNWRERWFTEDGALNHDISKALCNAFVDAVRQVEHDWKEHRYYQYLRHTRPEAAQLTLDALRLLREDGADLFQQPHQLVQVARQEPQERVLGLLDQDGSRANEYLKPALDAFLFGHDDEFVTFVAEQFGPHWILRFVEILKDPGEEGTRAWRACQLLWQKSLRLGIGQIQQTTTETAATVRWLQEWARQLTSLPPSQRDSLGQEALEEILHSVHAQLDEMQKTLDKTYATILDIKATVEQVYQKVVPALPTPAPIWNVPFARNPFFTGRSQLLERLHEQLFQSKSAALTQPAALSGLGGIGKTQAAIEYAYRYREEYRAVFWVRAESRDTLIADYVAIAQLLGLPGHDAKEQMQVVATVKRWLHDHEGWLLLLDNADEISLLPDFVPHQGQGHLLLTTRAQVTGKLARSVSVEKMEMSEGIRLLLRRAKLLLEDEPLETVSAATRSAAKQLVEELDGLPLALDQAGAYLEETGCSLSEYLALYARHRLALLQRKSSMASEYPHTVASTWALSFSQVEQADPAAADVLRVCAFLHPDAIPEAILTEGAAALGPQLQQVASEPLLLNEAIYLLRRYSLVKRDPEAKLLNLHRLVQVVLKESLDETTRQQWAERTVRAVAAAFPAFDLGLNEVANWPRCEQCLPHVQTCLELIDQYGLSFPEAAHLLNQAGYYLWNRGRFGQAQPLLQRALAICEKVLGPEHPETASTLNNLAELYRDQGKYEQAEPLFQRALTIREIVLGPEHLDTTETLNGLAALYFRQGKYKQAEPLKQRALTIREKVLGPEHPDIGEILNDLALLYFEQGKYEQAEPLQQRALAICEKVLGPEHPHTATCLDNLAAIYRDQGKFEQAEPLFQRALAINDKMLGPEYPKTAIFLGYQAELYRDQGKYEQAEPLLQRALAICEKTLGPDHPQTATVLDIQGHLALLQGREEQAASLLQRALTIREQVLGNMHPFVAETLQHLAELSEKQSKYEQARTFYQRALAIRENAFGAQHFKTTQTRTRLITLLHALGQDEDEPT